MLGSGIEREWDDLPPAQTTFDGALVDAMTASLVSEEPTAAVLPDMLSAGTDAKSFQQVGIRHFGFAPLQLPGGLSSPRVRSAAAARRCTPRTPTPG